ncbi:MAG: AAA domain-containing protein [Pirellulaceae bacterium]|nr:AAA domain-containing protein [Pirellulaceae bacterium]
MIARAVVRMTELDREKRVQDLPALIKALENYRQQDVEVSVEPSEIEGFESRDLAGKQQVLLDRLQQRLFEISRSNRMLHFRPTMQSINLTQASVPLSFDYQNIREDQILTCDRELEKTISLGRSLSLNKRLNFEEAIYLPNQLNRIARETRRDFAEFGFEQLRLVLCSLEWWNLKEKPCEKFSSPLVLVPVKLKKKRGVRDTWELEPLSEDAEINPVVRHLFRKWYDIDLPERVDLETTDLTSLFDFMAGAIAESEPAVELKKVERPRLRVLQKHAQRRLDGYRRRARLYGRGVRAYREIDYSYDPATYHPLGVKIFSKWLQLPTLSIGDLERTTNQTSNDGLEVSRNLAKKRSQDSASENSFEDVKEPNHSLLTLPVESNAKSEQTLSAAALPEETNPYNWTFDLCSVTLANFSYRKMSLVRDYEQLLTEVPHNAPFEAAFSLVPRALEREKTAAPALLDRFDVVPCDPTQASSISQSRVGESYIIQGPPGTGKSQTITNLIADYVARGQRVLFVCEKRAAIDVVFARLRQCGLAPLCSLIHDSQADKKSFVMDLGATYSAFQDGPDQSVSSSANRQRITDELQRDLQVLEAFSEAMRETATDAGVPTSQLIEKCIETSSAKPELSELQKERLPDWAVWNEGRAAIDALVATLERQDSAGVLARHPLRYLREGLSQDQQPLQTVTHEIEVSGRLLEALEDSLRNGGLDPLLWNLSQWRRLAEHATKLLPFADAELLSLLDSQSQASVALAEQQQKVELLQTNYQEACELNAAWKQKIPRRDLQICIDTANEFTRKMLPILRPSWWRLRKFMNQSYDFDIHPVKPSWVAVLTQLQAEYEAQDALGQAKEQMAAAIGLPADADAFLESMQEIRNASAEYSNGFQRQHSIFISSPEGGKQVRNAASLRETLKVLSGSLDEFFEGYEIKTVPQLQSDLNSIAASIGQLPDYLICLEQLQRVPETVRFALRNMDLRPNEIEAAAAAHTLDQILIAKPEFRRFSQKVRATYRTRLEATQSDWMKVNSEAILEKTRNAFLKNAGVSDAGSSSRSAADRKAKRYSAGRKQLEHEFGKQMRYKSIRDLVSGDSGLVVRDLKPIWLMSPLSVSDTLPLGEQDFDVVIFDEASQITLESAIPSLFRASQTIVVGDEQQLPPTNFFSSKRDREEDEVVRFEEDGETVVYDLESNSLLNHAGRNLPSTMLGWHYRSRDEALISFSNWAFYAGRLLTIPEESIRSHQKPEISIQQANAASEHVMATLDRPISFHHISNGIYESRRNRSEADYIAALIREILLNDDDRTLGVIAFSEAQQSEIELAVERLAREDSEFANLVEAESVREDDGQFVGLLIKNLENIQGDERDVVILSVCYGPNDEGRMIMNFGPINKTGGEKRLNVAFSRAKHHMAIVSSIKYAAITNEYNSGANCLRNYLRYAESVSTGQMEVAEGVLRDLSPGQKNDQDEKPVPIAVQHIATRLRGEGWEVDHNIGHSDFRCDLALRQKGDAQYRLGILVDAGDFYQSDVEVMDREVYRPRLLKVFGWQVYNLLIKDWLLDREAIVAEIIALCENTKQETKPLGAADPQREKPEIHRPTNDDTD